MAEEAQTITVSTPSFDTARFQTSSSRSLILVADACFEMFSVRELKKPRTILPELRAAFSECCDEEILAAVSMALSWKRLLRAAGKPLH